MVFDHAKFEVSSTIERATRIPYSSGRVYVRWNVTESPRPDTHGRTGSKKSHRTEAQFENTNHFKQRIGIRSTSRYLRTCPIKFEVVWEPGEGKGVVIGTLNLDLSQYALTKQHYEQPQSPRSSAKVDGKAGNNIGQPSASSTPRGNEAYGRPSLYLLEGARTNCLIGLKIKVDYSHGGDDYKIPPFDAPAVNFGSNSVAPELTGDTEDITAEVEDKKGDSKRNGRDKLRQLRADVFEDLRRSEAHKLDLDADWLDIDQFLNGHTVRAVPKKAFDESRSKGIRDTSEYDIEHHDPGTPYLETEIQEHFITWKIM